MAREHLVSEGTLTLPYGVLETLHNGVSDVRLYRNMVTQTRQVGKRVSLAGREDTLMVHEVNLLRQIDHPNIAAVYDVTEVVGSDPALAIYEIVMPYYEQGSVLDAMVKRNERFSVGGARDIALRALRGLCHLHDDHKVLHRDVKPGNLFLSGDAAVVKVGDFGEAMRIGDDGTVDPLTSPQFWTPPESLTPGARYTVKSELYSMGMSLHEMLSGPWPYDDYRVEQLADRLSNRRCAVLPRHLGFALHVPESLRRIVRKATRLSPSDRYGSADAMIRDLTRARFVDWSWPEVDEDEAQWRGRLGNNDYRVQARRMRDGSWRVRGERHYPSGWRRVPDCQWDGETLDDAAEAAFRQIDTQFARA